MTTLLTRLRSGWSQPLLMLGALLGCGGAVAALLIGSEEVPWWVILVTVALGLAAVVLPDTAAPSGFLLWTLVMWAILVPGRLGPELLLAAAFLLLVHLCTALIAALPPRGGLPPSYARVYLLRFGVLLAGTVAVWGLAGLVEDRVRIDAGPWPALAALILVLLVLTVLLLRTLSRDDTLDRELERERSAALAPPPPPPPAPPTAGRPPTP